MYKYLYPLVFLFLLACENNKQLLSIEGTLPGTEYDGEIIYLVPFIGATIENVDSTYIKDGAFRFEKQVNQKDMMIIRTRPLLRLRLQELLVAIEPGELHVAIDSVSTSKGTPLNDSLQQWKEKKMKFEETRSVLKRMLLAADDDSKAEFQIRLERLSKEYDESNYNFLQENRNNMVGQFVYKIVSGSLTEQQKQELDISQ